MKIQSTVVIMNTPRPGDDPPSPYRKLFGVSALERCCPEALREAYALVQSQPAFIEALRAGLSAAERDANAQRAAGGVQ